MPNPSRQKRHRLSDGSLNHLRRFLRDERGAVAIYIGLSSVLLFGATALAFDIGRVMSLQTELQSAADAAALAGAAELDGQTDAIKRAAAAAGCQAVTNSGITFTAVSGAFGSNGQTFATDGNGVNVAIPFCTFFSSLTSTDPALLSPNTSTQGGTRTSGKQSDQDINASFIKVVAQQRSLANAFITLVGGPQIASTTAVATAGFEQITCNELPLMICNPNETASNTNFTPVGGQELLVKQGPGSAWAPGNYGFVQPPADINPNNTCVGGNGNGAPLIEQFLAQDQPLGCFSTILTTRTGDPPPVSQAINVRFDLYQVSGNKVKSSDSCFAPAPDVIKGWLPTVTQTGNKTKSDPCNPVQSPNFTALECPSGNPAACAFPFPQDTCMNSGGSSGCTVGSTGNAVLGQGDWDFLTYWANNHGGTAPTAAAIQTIATNYVTNWNASNPGNPLPPPGSLVTVGGVTYPSRYAVYLYELATPAIPISGTPAAHQENGAPACYSGNANQIQASRRIVNVAVVNCLQQGVQGKSTNVHPAAVLQSFMIFPGDTNGDIFMEVIQQDTPNGPDNVVHNIVQLYR